MLVAVRKLMDKIFTKYELAVLDDLMPETVKKKLEESVVESASDSESDGDGQVWCPSTAHYKLHFPSLVQYRSLL